MLYNLVPYIQEKDCYITNKAVGTIRKIAMIQ